VVARRPRARRRGRVSLSLPGLGPLDGPRARRVLTAVAVLVLLAIGANSVRRAMRGRGSRYDENVDFSRELVYEGSNVYKTHPAMATHTKYPPFYFVYVAPFVPLPTPVGASLWFLLNAAMALATIVLAVRLAGPAAGTSTEGARAPPWTSYALLGGIMAWVVITNLSTAQVNIQIGFYVVLGLYLIRRGREATGGFALMVATMLKLTPALLLVWLAARRRWRALGGAAVGLLALWALVALVLGPDLAQRATGGWIDVLVPFARDGVLGEGIGGLRHTNQSLAAAFFRFFTDVPAGGGIHGLHVNLCALSFTTASAIVKALNVVLLLVVALAIGRPQAGGLHPRSRRFALEAGLLMVFMLIVSPISWMNHHVALILPYALLLQGWREAPPAVARRQARWIGLAVLLMLTSVWVLLMAFSLPLAGALLVGLLLARRLRHERAHAG